MSITLTRESIQDIYNDVIRQWQWKQAKLGFQWLHKLTDMGTSHTVSKDLVASTEEGVERKSLSFDQLYTKMHTNSCSYITNVHGSTKYIMNTKGVVFTLYNY